MEGQTRQCSKCLEQVHNDEFPNKKSHYRKCQNEYCRQYKAKNKEKISEYNKKYSQQNKDKILPKANARRKHRYVNDPDFKLSTRLRGRLGKLINSKKQRTFEYLGCELDLAKKWIESKFSEGMSWENHGKVWHIDHVMPCSKFDFTQEVNIYLCFSWTNLQPLFAQDNFVKNNRLIWKDLLEHEICVEKFASEHNLNINLFTEYLEMLKSTKFTTEKCEWHLGNQDEVVIISLSDKANQQH